MSKPTSPEWLTVALGRLQFILGEIRVVDSETGYCCMKHELEFGPVELDIFHVVLPHLDVEDGKLIHDVLMREARSAAKHRVIHMRGSPDGFTLSIAPYKKPREWEKPAE